MRTLHIEDLYFIFFLIYKINENIFCTKSIHPNNGFILNNRKLFLRPYIVLGNLIAKKILSPFF